MINSWQKITRVLPGQPFGNGSLGDVTISSNTTFDTSIYHSLKVSAGSTSVQTSAGLNAGDLVLMIQTRGNGAGNWEINQMTSGNTLKEPAHYSYYDSAYGDSSNDQAQLIKLKQFNKYTINSGVTLSPKSWDGNVGGILPLVVRDMFINNGYIKINGTSNGTYNRPEGTGSTGGGFYGGKGATMFAYAGEGTAGASFKVDGATRNGNGGGGGHHNGNSNNIGIGGGGGGNGTAGTVGKNGQTTGGLGGSTSGNNDLSLITFGGGGGGGSSGDSAEVNSGYGGSGGGIIMVFAKHIDINNQLQSKGGRGGTQDPPGGSGAGGSILLCGYDVDIGTDKIDVRGGDYTYNNFGKGGDGRVAVYYGGLLSGSLSSTYYGTYKNEYDTNFIIPIRRSIFI